jgi:hypothetical protein
MASEKLRLKFSPKSYLLLKGEAPGESTNRVISNISYRFSYLLHILSVQRISKSEILMLSEEFQ